MFTNQIDPYNLFQNIVLDKEGKDVVKINPRTFVTEMLVEIEKFEAAIKIRLGQIPDADLDVVQLMQITPQIIESVDRSLRIYDKGLELIPFKVLKALIMHDVKGIIGNCRSSLEIMRRGSEDRLSETVEQLERLRAFISFGLIAAFSAENETTNELLLEFLLKTYAPFENLGDGKYVLQINDGENPVNFEADLGTQTFSRYGRVLWPVHTIILNMVEKGAKNIKLELIETEHSFIIEIHDDIVESAGHSGIELISYINERIQQEPTTRTETGDLLAKSGLPIARVYLNESDGTLWCQQYSGENKTFIKSLIVEINKKKPEETEKVEG